MNTLTITLLNEWNNSAIVVLFLLFLIPVIIVFIVLRLLFQFNPGLKRQKDEWNRNSMVFILFNIVLFLASIVLAVAILALLSYTRGKGLLE
ncbi:MAG: hypothetical protein JWO44_666 [Bacteroidetes bacterium]|nr:hypothetical protein [Bacteroidota bacterium]